jgi:hypothetical protein
MIGWTPRAKNRAVCDVRCQNDARGHQELYCSNIMLSLLYVLTGAKRADFSTISTFVNFLMAHSPVLVRLSVLLAGVFERHPRPIKI